MGLEENIHERPNRKERRVPEGTVQDTNVKERYRRGFVRKLRMNIRAQGSGKGGILSRESDEMP